MSSRRPALHVLLIMLLGAAGLFVAGYDARPGQAASLPPLVFVARSHLATEDVIFDEELGPAGQFGTGLPKFAPGSRLVRRNADGSLSLYTTPGLVDVQAPDVSFDAARIVFAGARSINPDSPDYGWRLYEINVDGSGFRQLTFSNRTFPIPNGDQFRNDREYGTYDDFFPAYLADGRIAFVSSRYPTRAHYDERRTFNLYIADSDGGNLHRVTSDRGGMLHPTPLPDGRILLTRWWNNFNQPTLTGVMNRIDNRDDAYVLDDGTIVYGNPDAPFNPPQGALPGGQEIREGPNTWHLMTVHPDGTNLQRFAWTPVFEYALTDDSGHFDTYAATQPALLIDGDEWLVAFTAQTDSTMVHTTLETGIRVARPGVEMMAANARDAIAGLTYEQAWDQDDRSGPYALHPWGLPDGRILYSQSREDGSLPGSGSYTDFGETFDLQGSNLRYELHTMTVDGGAKTVVPLNLGAVGLPHADAMDAKPLVARSGWQPLADGITAQASDDPRYGNLPNTLPEFWFSEQGPGEIATATIHNPNIYANPSLYEPFVNNSPPPGSVAAVEIWLDANQFTGAHCYNDYPQPCDDFRPDNQIHAVLWDTVPVSPLGEFTAEIPADVPGFFVLRGHDGAAVRSWSRGYISIAQGNAWARPGETVTCVGCHMGHVSGSVAAGAPAQGWTNVAPYARVAASSFHNADDNPYEPFVARRVVDRRGWAPAAAGVPGPEPFIDDHTGWISDLDQAPEGQWVALSWPVDMRIRALRLVGPPPLGGDWDGFGEPAQYGDFYVEGATLAFFRDGSPVGSPIDVGRIEPLSGGGTLVTLPAPRVVDEVRLTITAVTGRWYWSTVAALSEIEIEGQAAEPWPNVQVSETYLPLAPER